MDLHSISEAVASEAKAARALSDIMWLMTSISEDSDLRITDIYEGLSFIMNALAAHINKLSSLAAEILRISNNKKGLEKND